MSERDPDAVRRALAATMRIHDGYRLMAERVAGSIIARAR